MHWRKYHIAVLSNLVEDLISHGWGYLGVKLVYTVMLFIPQT